MKTNQYLITLPIFFTLFIIFPSQTFAQSHVGTITSLKGEVKLLSKRLPSGSKVLRYEGETYSYKKARIGRRIKSKQIILTGPRAQVKIVYSNGDHFNIGPGSSMTMPTKGRGKNKQGTSLKLYYGKVRALISKRGPRSNLILKTNTAVAGVRGTDFFLSTSGAKGTKLSVMRGSVAIAKDSRKNINIPTAKMARTLFKNSITIKKGFTATLASPVDEPPTTELKPQPAKALSDGDSLPELTQMANKTEKNPNYKNGIKITPVTREVLIQVEQISTINISPTPLNESVRKEIERLQKKSTIAVMEDIKDDDPKLYRSLIKNKIENSNDINSAVVAKLFKKAPREKVKQKLSEEDLNKMNDVYEKFFKKD